jgi:hypothetical protein
MSRQEPHRVSLVFPVFCLQDEAAEAASRYQDTSQFLSTRKFPKATRPLSTSVCCRSSRSRSKRITLSKVTSPRRVGISVNVRTIELRVPDRRGPFPLLFPTITPFGRVVFPESSIMVTVLFTVSPSHKSRSVPKLTAKSLTVTVDPLAATRGSSKHTPHTSSPPHGDCLLLLGSKFSDDASGSGEHFTARRGF